jgi:hypothetical protein
VIQPAVQNQLEVIISLTKRSLPMKEESMQFISTIQQIRDEFKIIALTALIATVAIWVYVSLNLLWTAAVYFGFLIFISILYGTIDYFSDTTETVEKNS